MKHLYVLVFILSFLSIKAQNWQVVYSDRLVCFDSSRQAIKIVSTSVDSTGDSTFKNYPQLFMDSLGRTYYFYGRVKDSVSWIGRRIVIKTDGYNGFANDSNEFSWLHTQASPGDTFTYFENKNRLVKGYCSRIFYADTFGISDSIKQYKFRYFNKPGYTTNFDTTLEILLSKHHGLLKTPFYCATRDANNPHYIRLSDKTITYFTGNYFTNRRFNNLDIGDEYEYKTENDYQLNHYYENRYYYKVTGKENIPGTDSVKYTFLVRKLLLHKYQVPKYPYGPYDWYWQTTTQHIVYNENKTLLVNDEAVNGWLPGQVENQGVAFSNKIFYFIDTCNLIVNDEFYGAIHDTVTNIFEPPFESTVGTDYYSRIGFLTWFLDGSTGTGKAVGEKYTITYKNFCNTVWGTPFAKIYVYGTGVQETTITGINIYPNPAAASLTIEGVGIKAITFTDINGKSITPGYIVAGNIATVDVSGLLAGLYFCKVATETQTSIHKVIIGY